MIAADDVIARFEAGEVAAGEFDHRAHVRLAWCYLRRYPLLEAIAQFCAALQAFTKRVGAEAKYHETVSVAFLLLIADGMHPDEDWSTFADRRADLINGGMEAIRVHYSAQALDNDDARRRFMMPDRRLRTEVDAKTASAPHRGRAQS